jgi:phosphoesterase RecJ-like protein
LNDTIKSIATIMKDLDGILIFPHMNMDGDSLGSSTALCLALRSLGKKAYVMINEPVPKNLDFLEC